MPPMALVLAAVMAAGAPSAAGSAAAQAAAAREDVVGLDNFRGSEAARRRLLENGFVVTDETYRQICSFYIHRSPAFVTTDSVLYAYGLAVEKALRRLEEKQAQRLLEILTRLPASLDAIEKEELVPLTRTEGLDPAWLAALPPVRAYVQVAAALAAGRTTEDQMKDLPAGVVAEVRLALAAKQRAPSPLRGLQLDYTRFQPRGLYVGDEALERFYRAMTWLQEVPFLAADEGESRQAVLLLHAAGWDFEGLDRPYSEFLGPPDDAGPAAYRRTPIPFGWTPFFRQFVEDKDLWAKGWEQIRQIPAPRHTTILTREAIEDPGKFKGLRLLPRPALFDNDLLKPLAPFGVRRPPVSGEELMAVMGSKAARAIVTGREAKEIPGYERLLREAVEAVPEAGKRCCGRLEQARRALYHALLDEPTDKSLPSYYRHPAWRYKDLNTCLAAWAHHRYAWDMHGKRFAGYGGGIDVPPGIVEPNPAFFDALLDLAVLSDKFFRDLGAGEAKFGDLAALIVDLRGILRAQLAHKPLTRQQEEFLRDYGPRLANACGFESNSWLVDEDLPDTPFCVPVSIDMFTEQERVVGQARPRAIYVVCQREGKRFLTVGGVLSYRDHVGPAQGPDRMSSEKWRARAQAEALDAPAWHEKFADAMGREELLRALRRGALRQQMFYRPDRPMGDILAEKLARKDPFTLEYASWEEPRAEAVRLFGATNHPKVVEMLFPVIEKPDLQEKYHSWYYWPEARALDGKLTREHAAQMMKWVEKGYGHPELVLGLAARIPGQEVEDMLLEYLDRTAAEIAAETAAGPSGSLSLWSGRVPKHYYDSPFEVVVHGLLDRPGLGASRMLAVRLDRYEGSILHALISGLERKWGPREYDPETGSKRPRVFSEEEQAFLKELRPAIERARKRLPAETRE